MNNGVVFGVGGINSNEYASYCCERITDFFLKTKYTKNSRLGCHFSIKYISLLTTCKYNLIKFWIVHFSQSKN